MKLSLSPPASFAVAILALFLVSFFLINGLEQGIETLGAPPTHKPLPSPLPDLVLTGYRGDIQQMDETTFRFKHDGTFLLTFELDPPIIPSGITCNSRYRGETYWEGTFGPRTLYDIERDGALPAEISYNSSFSDLLPNAMPGDVFDFYCSADFYYPYFEAPPNYDDPIGARVEYVLIAE